MKRILGSLSVLSLALVMTAIGYSQPTTPGCCRGPKPSCCDKGYCCKGNHKPATPTAPTL